MYVVMFNICKEKGEKNINYFEILFKILLLLNKVVNY